MILEYMICVFAILWLGGEIPVHLGTKKIILCSIFASKGWRRKRYKAKVKISLKCELSVLKA